MPRAALKKTIAVDIDDVLAANAEGFAKFSNERWGTNLKPDDYTEHWAEVWQVDFPEVEIRRETIFQERVFLNYRFFNEAKPALKSLAKKYNLVVVSSRSRRIQKDTVDWLRKEYGNVFFEIHFAKIWDEHSHILEKLKMTKAELCKEVGANYLIDDQPKHCIAVAEARMTSLLFGDYKWNKDLDLPAGVIRVKNWSEVLEYFNEQS